MPHTVYLFSRGEHQGQPREQPLCEGELRVAGSPQALGVYLTGMSTAALWTLPVEEVRLVAKQRGELLIQTGKERLFLRCKDQQQLLEVWLMLCTTILEKCLVPSLESEEGLALFCE
jgi:hypothetical protein